MGFKLVTRVAPSVSVVEHPGLISDLARCFLHGVVASNRAEMRLARAAGRPLPLLYQSGIRYQFKPAHWDFQEFEGVIDMLERGWAECPGFCAYRLAELYEAGELEADFLIKCLNCLHPSSRPGAPRVTMHIKIRRADGTEECPSSVCGMPRIAIGA